MRTQAYLTGTAWTLAFVLGACTPATRNAPVENWGVERTTMTVENNNWSDMTVYLLREGVRTRLGVVPSMGRSNFTLSSALIGGNGDLRVMADPLGSNQRWTSQPMLITPGSQIRFRLENNVNLSTYSVY
jgi:hypothetical protein